MPGFGLELREWFALPVPPYDFNLLGSEMRTIVEGGFILILAGLVWSLEGCYDADCPACFALISLGRDERFCWLGEVEWARNEGWLCGVIQTF
jgi:hypothetical protein